MRQPIVSTLGGCFVKTKALISLAALLLVVLHHVFPNVKPDATSLVLVVIGVLPWLTSVIKSLELPGGFKIELADVKSAAEKVKVDSSTADQSVASGDSLGLLQQLVSADPNLVLVGIRIELERRLVTLAEAHNLNLRNRSAGILTRELSRRDILDQRTAGGLADLIGLGNRAAHGADVSEDAAEWALQAAPAIYSALDGKIRDASSTEGTA